MMKYYSSNGRSPGRATKRKTYEIDEDFDDLEDLERVGISLTLQELETELDL